MLEGFFMRTDHITNFISLHFYPPIARIRLISNYIAIPVRLVVPKMVFVRPTHSELRAALSRVRPAGEPDGANMPVPLADRIGIADLPVRTVRRAPFLGSDRRRLAFPRINFIGLISCIFFR